jgi:endo-1,4-beta-xylanase
MLNRRAFLRNAAATGAWLGVGMSGPAQAQTEGLRALAMRRNLAYGCATATDQLKDADFASALVREAGLLVAEYEMKRNAVERTRGHYDFAGGDALLNFAKAQGMALRGHTLVWFTSNPDWLPEAVKTSRDETLLTAYVNTMVRHYRGALHSWDVVNEAIDPTAGRSDGLRPCFWLEAFGPSYIDLAFQAARAADPSARLVYNDQGCEGGTEANHKFRAATLSFLEGALKRGVPIDALGLQGHLQAFGPPVDQKKLRVFLENVRALGLRILVTEHDVDDSGGSRDSAVRDQAVADASRRFLDVVFEAGGVDAVLTWGLSDRYLEQAGFLKFAPRRLPLDSALKRKPMWQAMARSLAG